MLARRGVVAARVRGPRRRVRQEADRGLSDYKALASPRPRISTLRWFQPLCLDLDFRELERPAELFPQGRVVGFWDAS